MQDQSASLDALIQRIRQQATQPPYNLPGLQPLAAPLHVTASGGSQAISKLMGREPLSQNTAKNVAETIHHLDQLLLIADPAEFIDTAYQVLLHRPADAAGLAYYTQLLSQGYGQHFVAAALRASDEARQANTSLCGWGLSPLAYNLWRIARRIGLTRPARWVHTAYAAWRAWKLLLNGQVVTQQYRQQQEINRMLRQVSAQAEALEISRIVQSELAAFKAHIQAGLHQIDQTLQQSRHTLVDQGMHLLTLQARMAVLQLRAAPASTRPATLPGPSETPAHAAPGATADELDDYYLAFENAHRGPSDAIRQRLTHYLPHISRVPHSSIGLPMVDVGCGRGEWLQLLQEQGFNAQGIDISANMVRHAQAKGLQVQHAPALPWLQSRAESSLAVITAFHVAEHLPFDQLFGLVRHAHRTLVPGGILILETPNPENILVGSHTFYHDPTHRNPLTPTALEFLYRYHGFQQIHTVRLNPYPSEHRITDTGTVAERINGHLYGPQDFAVIGYKANLALSGADAHAET